MTAAIARIAATAVLALTTSAFAQGNEGDLKPFPEADAGMKRHVISVPEEANEDDLRVEILPGKVLEVDCNRVMISAQVERKTVEGWGYDYLVLDKVSPPASTMMACPDDSKVERFVTIRIGAESMQRYNSKLPLVVYAPEDITVKYRIWRAEAELRDATVE